MDGEEDEENRHEAPVEDPGLAVLVAEVERHGGGDVLAARDEEDDARLVVVADAEDVRDIGVVGSHLLHWYQSCALSAARPAARKMKSMTTMPRTETMV